MAANLTDDLLKVNETNLWFDMSTIIMMYKPFIDARRSIEILSNYVLTPIGVLGSVLTIVILRRSSMTSTSLYVYLMTIALFDGIGGISGIIFILMTEFTVISTIFCQSFYCMSVIAALVPDFLVAAVSVEKALAIVFPFKVKNISTSRKAKMVVIAIILVCLTIGVLTVWTWVADPSGIYCVKDDRHIILIQITLVVVMALMILTFLVALTCCCIITHHLHKHHQIMASLQSQTGCGAKQDAQISAMLLSISLLYVITNFPVMIFYIADAFFPWINLSFYHLFLFHLLYEITIFLINMNHSLNFYLYLLSARFFREETKALFCRCLGRVVPKRNVLQVN